MPDSIAAPETRAPHSRLLLIAGVALPAVVCAVIGLSHPMTLTAASAAHWQLMHVVLIPLFPLIGLAPWLVARQVDRRLGVVAGVLGYGFATFYTSLDLLAGVAAGTVVLAGMPDATTGLYEIGRVLARIGYWSLLLGTLVAAGAAVARARLAALPGAVLALAGAALVYRGHIYVPVGTAAMLLLAAGFTLLAIVVTRPRTGAQRAHADVSEQTASQ